MKAADGRQREAMNKDEVLAWLELTGTRTTVEGMTRYGIPNDRAFGVPVGVMRAQAKKIGKDHDLAAALWETGWYEARMMATFVDAPQLVTRRQMNAWAADFDSWAICDTACFHLFNRTPFAWEKARQWVASPREFVKRGGFVIMAVLAARAEAPDAEFVACLKVIEESAGDARNFVKKGVNWALRQIGRRNVALNAAALEVAERLARSDDSPRRWVGKDALRELKSPKV